MIEFKYKTHRGTIENRSLAGPITLEFQFNPGFGYQPGWAISGSCPEREGAKRSFFLTNIVFPEPHHPTRLVLAELSP